MSEYQYYEFQAIDRPLTQEELVELRALSTRATITPTRFQNVYRWGDFKGDPLKLLERYFDVFVYVANWGTTQLMLRLPQAAIDREQASRYGVDPCLQLHPRDDYLILEFTFEDEDGGGWIEDTEAEGWLPSLLPLRSELINGDLRSLYLGWLAGAQAEMLGDDEVEPPVPPGLGSLSAALEALAQFLGIDEDLLAVAAERSAALQEIQGWPGDLAQWIRDLPDVDKNDWLLRLVEGTDPHLRTEIIRRFRQTRGALGTTQPPVAMGERTVAALRSAAKAHAERRDRHEAERKARERAAYIDSLIGREEEIWREVETLTEAKRAAEYDRAVELLKDLRDLSVRDRAAEAFQTRLVELRARHAGKRAFTSRLDQARSSLTSA